MSLELPALTPAQLEALIAVCAVYLAGTEWVSAGPVAMFPEPSRAEILQRRAVCRLIVEGV